jgi:predicted Rossmann fold nucleotide-binding protein DprA/Smf involved in DNA uptake
MQLSSTTQAILLLTARFSDESKSPWNPLTPIEYGRFAVWMRSQEINPAMLLRGDPRELLKEWSDPKIPVDRVEALISRGPALALSVEKWARSGIWVMDRSDPDYPRRYKQRLDAQAPAILFGCGNKRLLGQGGLAVVGSRRAANKDLNLAQEFGRFAANEGGSIISGGAKGIDEAAMMGSLEAEGTVVGVLACELIRAASAQKYRKHLMNDNLALISAVNPEARFMVGNAMARNKYIYCLADAAVVVCSGTSGGTWSGAQETLKKGWVPVWVNRSEKPDSGNEQLITSGGRPLPRGFDDLSLEILSGGNRLPSTKRQDEETKSNVLPVKTDESLGSESKASKAMESQPESTLEQMSFYEFFLLQMRKIASNNTLTEAQIAKTLELKQGQVREWLSQALQDDRLSLTNMKPKSYKYSSDRLVSEDVRKQAPDLDADAEEHGSQGDFFGSTKG